MPLTVNISIASPLLSRFDLVFLLLDTKDERWDDLVASYILEGRDLAEEFSNSGECHWDLEKLRAYFEYCKRLQSPANWRFLDQLGAVGDMRHPVTHLQLLDLGWDRKRGNQDAGRSTGILS